MSSIIVYSSSGTLLLLLLLSFLSFAMSQSSLYGGLKYIDNDCPSDENNTASATYMYNVGCLFRQNPYDGGNKSIDYKSIDYGDYPDKVYGLYLCRFDITGETCQNCIAKATDMLVKECMSNKTAIIWFEECMVRYSNVSFFSTLETLPSVGRLDQTIVTHPDVFNGILNQTFNKAIAMLSASNYATQNVTISNNETLYSLVQCIPDLSRKDCRACLNDAVYSVFDMLKDMFNGSRGGIYLNPSCNMRYELYPFYGDTTPTVAAPAPNTPSNNSSNTGDWESKRKKESRAWIIPITITASAIVVVLLSYFLWRMLRKNKRDEEESANSQEVQLIHLRDDRMGNEYSDDALQRENRVESQEFPLFPLGLALEATQHFCDENKLGEGGFGPVYKGILADGKEIAVKRLSKTSGQGLREFKNEVTLIAKLQHKNLVRLLGCCLEGNELLLIYEFMPNKSLDFLLFDSSRSVQLDWKTRFGIIKGIARGLLYLHEDSRLRIIHRDMKASNVLLDHDMNPKISDFGMAKIFGGNQTEANTNRVVGTYGYMAPEYAMEGLFSIKSDVFSFGVLILEIISGRKNSGFHLSEPGLSLLNYTWKLWCEGQTLKLMDPVIKQSCDPVELLRCIHIGLLCVQEDPVDRPTMSSVVVMLASDSIKLPQPTQPAFSVGRVARLSQLSQDAIVCSVNEVTLSILSPR